MTSLAPIIIFGIIGLCIGIFIPYKKIKNRGDCTYPVTAYIVDYRKHTEIDSGYEIYAPVYEYIYNDKQRKAISNNYRNSIPKINSSTIIYINPNTTNIEFYEPKHDNLIIWLSRIIGIIFIIVGFIFAFK